MEEQFPEPKTSLTFMAFVYAGFCVFALAILPSLQTPLSVYEAESHIMLLSGKFLSKSIIWGLGAGVFVSALSQAVSRLTSWGQRLSDLILEMMGNPSISESLMLAALSGFAEELLFRGLLLPYLGLTASTLLFGMVHFIPRDGLWPWSLWALAAGFVFGVLALHTGGLLAPILVHFMVNAVGLLTLKLEPD